MAIALADTLRTEHGPPTTAVTTEQVGPTLEESLKRVEELLRGARAHFDNAKALEAASRAEEQRIGEQRLEQEESLRQRTKLAEAELAATEQKVTELREDAARRDASLAEREVACRAREAQLAEQGAHLAARETNAKQEFSIEKASILGPAEKEVHRLRDEQTRIESEIAARQAEAEARLSQETQDRTQRWFEEDTKRARAQAEQHHQFTNDMARERQEAQAALRAMLESERKKTEAAWQADLDRRIVALDQQRAELDDRDRKLLERQKSCRAMELDLQVAQEILAEDRAGHDRKVKRLVDEQVEAQRYEARVLQKYLDDACSQRDTYLKELESRRELDRHLDGRTPDKILSSLAETEKERDSLAQQLRERPDARASERLSRLEHERSAWLEERAVLQADLARAQGELATRRLAAIELETLRMQKEALEVHKLLLDSAVSELGTKVRELTQQDDHRNPMTALTSLDNSEDLQAEARTTHPFGKATPTLREFADDLRHRIAEGVEGRTLYYAERDVRSFLGGLAMTHLMLLQGISGTGKTSLPMAFTSAVGGGIEIVEVQAGWRDRQDLVGYYNAFHRHYYATNFLQALYRAGTPAYRDRLFMMVLDEINLSRPEQFFADFLSALEQPVAARRLTLVNDPVSDAPKLMVDGRHLPIPPNVWFIGTANHDESTAEFADKTYDRAHVMEMPRKTDAAHFAVQTRGHRNAISYENLEVAFNEATRAQAATVQKSVAWLRSAPFADDLQRRFQVGWGNRLENQLARYLPVVVASGGSIGEAMDHLLVTKVLRKLRDRHDVRASALDELSSKLQTAWGTLDQDNLPERCVTLLENEIAAKKGEELV